MFIFELELGINMQAFVSLVLKCFLIFAISGIADIVSEISYTLNQLNECPMGMTKQPGRAKEEQLQREQPQGESLDGVGQASLRKPDMK